MPRYVVTVPNEHDAWWKVVDTQSFKEGVNFAVADFFRDMPNAEAEARALCDRLNGGNKTTKV